jgi:hypothetical protein
LMRLGLWSNKRHRHAAHEEIVSVAETVRASDLDWTILRLAVLDNKAKPERVRAGHLGRGQVGTSISHAEIASFILPVGTGQEILETSARNQQLERSIEGIGIGLIAECSKDYVPAS